MAETITVESLKKINLNPGDVLIAKTHERLDKKTGEELGVMLNKIFPDNKNIIIPPDFEFSIVRIR